MFKNCIYPIEVELSKLKKLSKMENITKEDLYKQIKELKWKIYLFETYIDYVDNKGGK